MSDSEEPNTELSEEEPYGLFCQSNYDFALISVHSKPAEAVRHAKQLVSDGQYPGPFAIFRVHSLGLEYQTQTSIRVTESSGQRFSMRRTVEHDEDEENED